jgi:hypothetical protein
MAQAQIPITDAMFLILLASVSPAYTPKQDDLIIMDGVFHKIRRILKVDPATAAMEAQCYVIQEPQ